MTYTKIQIQKNSAGLWSVRSPRGVEVVRCVTFRDAIHMAEVFERLTGDLY